MDKDKKSNGKDVSVKSIKCNNVNVNVNGLELNLTSVPFLSGLLASEAHEGERGASSYGSDGSYGDKSRSDGDFKFICINNNNNTVIGVDDGETPIPPPPPPGPETCQGCFDELSANLQTAINAFLAGQEAIPLGDMQEIPAEVNNIAQLCAFLNQLPITLELTPAEVEGFITGFLGAIPQPPPLGAEEELEALIECLIEAGVLVVQEVGEA
jgi:hypothetical protein